MNKLLRRSKAVGLFLITLEILGLIAVLLCFIYFPDFDYYFHIALILPLAFIIFFFFFFWVHTHRLQKMKRRTELKAADVIGTDIQEAYFFGKIGLALTDDDGVILWVNEFLEDRNIDFIDQKIDEVFKEIQSLYFEKSEEPTTKVMFQNHIYEIKLIKGANLYIFKDITEYETLFKYSNDQSPVVGFINIDNYADVATSFDDGHNNDMISAVRKLITTYCYDHQIMIKSLKEDTYLIMCSKKNYEDIYKDHFSILDKVRSAYDDGYTLSIGIAHGFPDYTKLMELASNATDVALSRGGDQVVIAPFSENMEFIGGKTEARVSRNKVKIRTISQSLLALISHSSNVLIMGHINADFDAIGACLGVQAIATHAKIDSRIIFEDQLIEKKVRRAVKTMFSPKEMQSHFVNLKAAHEYYNENTLIIIVDCNNPAMVLYPNIIEENSRVAIIDHHRRSDNYFSNVIFSSIDPSASSASELISEYISYNQSKIEVPSDYATMMLCGILLDTNFYRHRTTLSTYEASAILKQFGADNEKADEFLKEEYEEYALKTKIMAASITPYYGILICVSEETDIIDISMLAIVAREALMIRGVNACFVVGKTSQSEARISSRSDGSVNCQLLMEKLGGGGHFTSAAAQFKDSSVEDVKKKLLHILDEYMQQARTSSK